MSEVLKELKRIKKKNKYTYDELSRRLGFHSSTIARWFRLNKINRLYESMLYIKMKDL